MKKLILLPVLFLLILSAQAQYSDYKNDYNHKEYVHQKGDKYNPTVAGLLSVIPSAGLFYVGQPGQAALFLLGMGGSLVLSVGGMALALGGSYSGAVMFFGGAASFITFYIWSIVRASRIAKIKNLKLGDSSVSFKIEPFLDSGVQNIANVQNVGLSLKFSF